MVVALLAAGCGEERRPEPVPTPERWEELDRLPAKTGGFDALVQRRKAYEAARRAEIARMRRSTTVEAALRVARLTGRITPGAEGSMRAEWQAANATLARMSGVRQTESRVRGRRRPRARRRRTSSTGRPAAPHVPHPAPERAVLEGPARARLGLAHDVRARPHDLPVLPGPRPAAPAARELGPGERDRRRVPRRDALEDQEGHVPARGGDALAGPARLARRAPQRLPRVGVLLRLRQRRAAVGVRDDAGDRRAGARPWLPGARLHALEARRSARSGRSSRPRRPASRCRCPAASTTSCTRSRRATTCSTAGCRPCWACATASALLHSSRARRLFRAGDRAARRQVADYDTGAWSLYSSAAPSRRSATTRSRPASSAGCATAPTRRSTAGPTRASSATSASRRGSTSPRSKARAGTERGPCASRSRRCPR